MSIVSRCCAPHADGRRDDNATPRLIGRHERLKGHSKHCFHNIPEPVLLCDVAVVAVHGEILGVENVLVATVAKELFVVLVERARVQRDPAVEALDAPSMERSAVGRHHLHEKKNVESELATIISNAVNMGEAG